MESAMQLAAAAAAADQGSIVVTSTINASGAGGPAGTVQSGACGGGSGGLIGLDAPMVTGTGRLVANGGGGGCGGNGSSPGGDGFAWGGAIHTAPGSAEVSGGEWNSARAAYSRNCQGCHRSAGDGVPSHVPALRHFVGYLMRNPAGRAYVPRVPGVAYSPLSDADLAALLNWLLPEFSASELPRLFDRFYRAAPADIPGTGLGLSIVDAIAKRHGLAVALENRNGGGLIARVVSGGKLL